MAFIVISVILMIAIIVANWISVSRSYYDESKDNSLAAAMERSRRHRRGFYD